ncbi:MAG: NUDIX domain-containing protein [Anaerolineae bacterium]|nr:NUDIX domain-containing protein [Anaerolineae bacterium]
MSEIQQTVVSVILINPKAEVLLQQRDDRPDLLYPGMWTLFGGSAETGETPHVAVYRELMEELGIDKADLIYWMNYLCPARSIEGQIRTTNHVYFASVDPEMTVLTLNEGQAMRWFSRKDAETLELAYLQAPVLKQFFEAGLHEYGKQQL